ncbi:MAG: hypothetical protein DRG78_06270 [Epsilonproteobacteria bacterium]|nr:MAG: hypothetical protein DRG78_06270 [Campylobacterota bacterium]
MNYDEVWLKASDVSNLTGISVNKLMNDAYKLLKNNEDTFNVIHRRHDNYPIIYSHYKNYFKFYNYEVDLKLNKQFQKIYKKLETIYPDDVSLSKDLNFYLKFKIYNKISYRYILSYLQYKDIGLVNIKKDIVKTMEKLLLKPKEYSTQYYLNSIEWLTISEAIRIKQEQGIIISKGSLYLHYYNYQKSSSMDINTFKMPTNRLFINKKKLLHWFNITPIKLQNRFNNLYFELENKFEESLIAEYLNITIDKHHANIVEFLKYSIHKTKHKVLLTYYVPMLKLNKLNTSQLIIYMREKYFKKDNIIYSSDWITVSEAMILYNKTYGSIHGELYVLRKKDIIIDRIIVHGLLYIKKADLIKYAFIKKSNINTYINTLDSVVNNLPKDWYLRKNIQRLGLF